MTPFEFEALKSKKNPERIQKKQILFPLISEDTYLLTEFQNKIIIFLFC